MKYWRTGAVLLVLMTAAVTASAGTNTVITLASEQTGIIPQTNSLYRLAPPIIYKVRDPGPKEVVTSLAWALANEFVFRTGLRDRCKLPSASARPEKGGTAIYFQSKDGDKQLRVFVTSDQTIEFRE